MRRPAALRHRLSAGFALLLFGGAAGALEERLEPRQPPPEIYRQRLQPLLTPADGLVSGDAAVLLDETFHFVAEDLAYYRVEHRVERASETAPRIAARFLPGSQKIWLALARSRPPEGTWRSDDVSLDRGGSEAVGELTASFPGLPPGSLAETVFVIEEPVLPIAGELTALLTFYGERPTALSRSLVELSAGLAARLVAVPVGAAPAEERHLLPGGRVRLEFSVRNPPPGRSAAIWLSTLGSWDRLADWYRQRLAARESLPPALLAEAADLTAAAAGPREAAALLYRRVADGVRGAASALGSAPVLPRRPEEVWSSGRGDSLDKAVLLRALLADRGIPSTVALINSRDDGAIETRSPDFRHFDRALLRIELPPEALGGRGRQVWADPGQPFLELGQLGLGDGERPAFLVPAAGGFSFATTPRASPPRVSAETLIELARRGDPRLAAAILAAVGAGDAAELASRVGAGVRQLEESGESGAANRLFLALEEVASRGPELAATRAELQRYFEARAAVGLFAAIARDLASLFETSPPTFWAETPVEPAADAAADAALVARFERDERIAPFLRQTVHLLTHWPPGPEFSRRLYQVAYTLLEHYPETPQVDGLLELMERLPKSDPNFWEGRALAGRRLAVGGHQEDALALYRQELADPALPPAFAAVFTALAAQTELRRGSTRGAAEGFAALERQSELSLPIVADGLVQGALLELDGGRPEAAAAYLRKLAEMDEKVVAASSSPRQALGLRELARDEKALRRAWASWPAWWPSWLELAAALAGDGAAVPAVPDDGLFLLGDLELLGRRFGALLSQGESRAAFGILRRLAGAARWDPQLALELSGSLLYLGTARPELGSRIHETAIILHRALPPFAAPEAAARSRLLLAAHLIDDGRAAEALEPLRDLLALQVGGALEQRGVTLLAMVALATGRGREQAAAELATALDDSFPADLRPTAVQHLADLYRAEGRSGEERGLLERELARPGAAAGPRGAELAARLADLRAGSDPLADAFAAWRALFSFDFLALAEPSSLADPRLAGKNESEMLTGDWLPPERVKVAFLLAQAGGRPAEARAAALAAVLPELRACLADQDRYRALLEGLLGERRFPAPLRSAAAFWLAYSWLQHENLEQADAFLGRRGLELSASQRRTLAELRALPAARKAGPAALAAFVDSLLGRPLSAAEAQLFPAAWRALALLGPEGEAERLAPRLERLALAAAGPEEAGRLAREAGDGLGGLLAWRRLRRELQASYGAGAPAARPALVDQLASPRRLEGLEPAACRGLLLYDLETLELGLAATPSWPAAFAACQEPGQGATQAALTLAVARSGLPDAERAAALLGTAGQLSDDDPAWPGLAEALTTLPEPPPATAEAVRLLLAQRRLRAGEAVDLAALRRELSPGLRSELRRLEARQLLHRRDPAAARFFLSGLAPGELAEPAGLLDRLELAGLAATAGPAPEKTALEAAARRRIYLARLAAVTDHSWSEERAALRLAAALGQTEAFAETPVIVAATQNPLGRFSLELAAAELARDWPAARDAARRMIAAESPDYDDYWNLARAAAEAGEGAEALAALDTFLARTRSHPREAEARALRSRLAAGGK